MCDRVIGDNEILNRLHEEKFDVAVVDALFFAKCFYLIPHRLQIPYITYTDSIDPLLVRVPWLPSFVPCGISPFSEKMTFVERLKNMFYLFSFTFILPVLIPEPPREVMDKFRRYGHFDSLDELGSKSVLWLSTKDDVLDYAKPTMPNVVNIGGLTVKRTTGELPSDINSFIDGAKKGVVLMTFGSVASVIPSHMVEKFSSAFRRLGDYRVIWRLDNEDNVKLPDNVMIAKWLPQNDILSHPSVKLFITHCGNNGQYEAVYHGVPMIGLPLAGDQIYNAKRLDHKGYGLSMDLYDFTADQLLDNIHKILGDKSYKERVTKASAIFGSQAQSPVEKAVFWIEHVCQFGGDHLRSAGNDLPLYSYLMLDVLAFILIILHILIYLLYRFIKYVMRICCVHRDAVDTLKKHE